MNTTLKGPIDSIFLVFLALMGSVGFKLLGCPLQDLLQNNVWARQITYFIVVLFTSSFLDDGTNPPLVHFRNAVLIYLFLIVFTKMTVRYTVIVFFLILTIYVLHIYMRYYNSKIQDKNTQDDQHYKSLIKNLDSITTYLAYSVVVILTIGFSTFVFHKKKQYGKKFDFIKFIFGVRACKERKVKNKTTGFFAKMLK